MSKTLSANEFSFQARTIRVYQDSEGQLLHIFHAMKVIVHRPDRLAVHAIGDDGGNDLFYEGKTVTVFGAAQNKYATIAAPNNIQATMDEVSDRLGVEFPLAEMNIAEVETFTAVELFTGTEYRWQGARQRLRLDPETNPAAIFRIAR